MEDIIYNPNKYNKFIDYLKRNSSSTAENIVDLLFDVCEEVYETILNEMSELKIKDGEDLDSYRQRIMKYKHKDIIYENLLIFDEDNYKDQI